MDGMDNKPFIFSFMFYHVTFRTESIMTINMSEAKRYRNVQNQSTLNTETVF